MIGLFENEAKGNVNSRFRQDLEILAKRLESEWENERDSNLSNTASSFFPNFLLSQLLELTYG